MVIATLIRILLSIGALLLEVLIPDSFMVLYLAIIIIIGFNLAAIQQLDAAAAAREEGARAGIDRMIACLTRQVQRPAEWLAESQDRPAADER